MRGAFSPQSWRRSFSRSRAPAIAGGRVEWKSTNLKESDSHSWTVDVSFYMNKAPDVAIKPVRFSFQPDDYYER